MKQIILTFFLTRCQVCTDILNSFVLTFYIDKTIGLVKKPENVTQGSS